MKALLDSEVCLVFYQKQSTVGVLFLYGLVEECHSLRIFLVYVGSCP